VLRRRRSRQENRRRAECDDKGGAAQSHGIRLLRDQARLGNYMEHLPVLSRRRSRELVDLGPPSAAIEQWSRKKGSATGGAPRAIARRDSPHGVKRQLSPPVNGSSFDDGQLAGQEGASRGGETSADARSKSAALPEVAASQSRRMHRLMPMP
jgi:hypothetical protein